MNTSYENFKKENRLRLFGHEDAGKEREERLLSYYYKTLQYEDIVSDIDLQIVTGEKGTGKSALLKMAFIEAQESSTVPIWIRLDDLSELYTNILNCDDLYQLKTLWKKSISKLIVMKLASDSDFIYSEDYEKALQWAYTSGYASRDFISRAVKLFKPLYEKYISVEEHPESGERGVLDRMIKNKKIRLFFDDFDLDWKGNSSDILKIKSLLLSLSDRESVEERKQSALSRIQEDMTKWAKELQLEYGDNPYRLDMNKVTVVVDKPERPVPLKQLGSGSNWVGVHLISYFALQHFFISANRPVPRFIFLDQPSQVYFPSEMDEKQIDWNEVDKMYQFIINRTNDVKGKLQVIVVDHADLKNDFFRKFVCENWWSSNDNLVPRDWYDKDLP